jgi:diacylglycerol kinase
MRKIMNSFLFAFNGLAYAFRTQLNFKIHCCFAIIVVFLGVFVKLNTSEWLWISLAIALVLVLELLNTAIEVLVDLVSPERNDKAGAIKDLAAAAVVVASLLALAIGLFIFVPKFI